MARNPRVRPRNDEQAKKARESRAAWRETQGTSPNQRGLTGAVPAGSGVPPANIMPNWWGAVSGVGSGAGYGAGAGGPVVGGGSAPMPNTDAPMINQGGMWVPNPNYRPAGPTQQPGYGYFSSPNEGRTAGNTQTEGPTGGRRPTTRPAEQGGGIPMTYNPDANPNGPLYYGGAGAAPASGGAVAGSTAGGNIPGGWVYNSDWNPYNRTWSGRWAPSGAWRKGAGYTGQWQPGEGYLDKRPGMYSGTYGDWWAAGGPASGYNPPGGYWSANQLRFWDQVGRAPTKGDPYQVYPYWRHDTPSYVYHGPGGSMIGRGAARIPGRLYDQLRPAGWAKVTNKKPYTGPLPEGPRAPKPPKDDNGGGNYWPDGGWGGNYYDNPGSGYGGGSDKWTWTEPISPPASPVSYKGPPVPGDMAQWRIGAR